VLWAQAQGPNKLWHI